MSSSVTTTSAATILARCRCPNASNVPAVPDHTSISAKTTQLRVRLT